MSQKTDEEMEFIKTALKALEKLEYREYDDKNAKQRESPDRSECDRDYARVLYSSSFRRLQGKMQLLGVENDKFFRNRLTHSLEVAQIARGIAKAFGYNDTVVVETGALAHDIGNPPFGHYGERVLNNLGRMACKHCGGFEGNAQTLRILTTLEKKDPMYFGLNLTYRSIFSVVKYFNKSSSGKSKFIYDDDYINLEKVVAEKGINPRTIDVQIVDLADEIAYAAHDLEDALSMQLFTIDELLFEFKLFVKEEKVKNIIEQSFYDIAFEKFKELISHAKKFADNADKYKSSEEYALLFRKELTSVIVNSLIKDISLVKKSDDFKYKTGSSQDKELGFKDLEKLAEGLKKVTFKCINRKNTIQRYEKMGGIIIEGLYDVLTNSTFNKDGAFLPVEYRMNFKNSPEKTVIDYISGMMDSYAISCYKDFYGSKRLEEIYSK